MYLPLCRASSQVVSRAALIAAALLKLPGEQAEDTLTKEIKDTRNNRCKNTILGDELHDPH